MGIICALIALASSASPARAQVDHLGLRTERAAAPIAEWLQRASLSPVPGGPDETGQISGKAVDRQGRPYADHEVRLRRLSKDARDLARSRSRRTSSDGTFGFAAVQGGQYVVDILRNSNVVATSGPISISGAGPVAVTVHAIEESPVGAGKLGAGGWMLIGAGVGAGLGFASTAGLDCDKPENLCPAAPVMGGLTGALMGLLIGASR